MIVLFRELFRSYQLEVGAPYKIEGEGNSVGRIVPSAGTPWAYLRRCFLEARGLDQMQQPPQKIGEANCNQKVVGWSVEVGISTGAISSARGTFPKKLTW